MRLLLLACVLVHHSPATGELSFHIQPQPVRINSQEEIYITSEDNYIGQVLYRFDRLQLECECQAQVNDIQVNNTQHHIYWSVNKRISSAHNNSKRMQLVVDVNSVQAPITFVACHCVFAHANLREATRDYRYKLYIDLEGEPSLQPIQYSVQPSMIKGHFDEFLRHHLVTILSLMLILVGITCPLMIINWRSFR